MRFAIVGNGPSALTRSEEIAACDQVVRINVPNMVSGDKWTVWASNFNADLAGKLDPLNRPPARQWLCVPRTYLSAVSPQGSMPIPERCEAEVSAPQWASLWFAAGFHRPTTGFVAVLLALEAGATELFLAGFDATTPKAPGWGSAAWDWAAERCRWTMHDFAAEKAALRTLRDTGEFCGKHYSVKVIWPDAADAPKAGPEPTQNPTCMPWLAVAYHTKDALYQRCADILRLSCHRFEVPNDIVALELAPGWAAGCRYKPEFIRQQLRKHYGMAGLLYLDVDAEFHKVPQFLDSLCRDGVDFAARWRGDEMIASALWIRNTAYMRDLVDEWAREVAEIPAVVPFRLQEQQALQRLILRKAARGGLQARELPAEYCTLYGLSGEPAEPVILQKQASRKALGDKHVPVHPELEEVGT